MIRDIRITAVLNGFTVQCGCQMLVYQSVDAMLEDIESYLKDPVEAERRVLAGAINRKHTLQIAPMMTATEIARDYPPPPNVDLAAGGESLAQFARRQWGKSTQSSEGCANP